MKKDLLFDMSNFNKIAFLFFIIAKFSGLVGVALGFAGSDYYKLGLFLLINAFVCIGISVAFSILQMSKDRRNFSVEDLETIKLKEIINKRILLEKEVQKLQRQKESLINLKIRNNI